MKNYTSILSGEEARSLCEIIGGKEFKDLFKKNPKEFSEIRPGFRANSLTTTDAVSAAIRYVDKPFIAKFINSEIKRWLGQIEDNINKLETGEINHEDAMSQALVDSYFDGYVELYFKIIGQSEDSELINRVKVKMQNVHENRRKDYESENVIAELTGNVASLTEKLIQAQKDASNAQSVFNTEISGYKQQIDTLKLNLAETQKQLDVLRSTSSFAQVETDNDERLREYDDRKLDVLPELSDENYFSLCKVMVDYAGQTWLIRMADINYRGKLEAFQKDSDRPSYFGNRDRLYYKDGPSEQDYVGVWKWSTVPNAKDPTKDYVTTNFYNELQPIEVIVISDCTSIMDITRVLQNGIVVNLMASRILFSCASGKGQYVGVLCDSHSMHATKGKVMITDDVITLPVYEFLMQDVIRLDDNLLFLRSVFSGIPSRLLHIKSPMEIVKNVVIDSISWSAYKQRGFVRAQYTSIKTFIEALPTDNILDGICAACHCNRAEAEQLLRKFFDSLNEYFDGKSIDDNVIRSAILSNEVLMQRAKEFVAKDWETENEDLVKERVTLQSELDSLNEDINKAHQEFDEITKKSKTLSDTIASKESLAIEVEEKVAARIHQAQNDVADFIASMAFVGYQMPEKVDESTQNYFERVHAISGSYMVNASLEDLSDLEGNDNWNGVVETAALELQEAGVSGTCARGFAAFLCAAYVIKQPIILIGPNARDIIAAFSMALTAGKYGILSCEGEYSNGYISEMGRNGESIVEIVNLLGSGWICRLPEILLTNNFFYIASHPFAEDIQVEPKSFYSFMLPVFTEFLVDKRATGKYVGGYFSDGFAAYMSPKNLNYDVTVMDDLNISALQRSQLRAMLSVMHDIYPESTADDDFLLAYLPYFYATMTMDNLKQTLIDTNEIAISTNLRRKLRHVLGEN